MEEQVQKRGILYLQQQKFGKKWKKVWSLVYGDSERSVSRLELFECRDDAERAERKRSKRDSRKVIRMSDLVRVAQKTVSCPRGCGTFLVETTEKSFLFAVATAELADWIRTLCEIAFPMNQGPCEAFMSPSAEESGMVENSIYCSSSELKDYHVTVKQTEASVRCNLSGAFILRVDLRALHLQNPQSGDVCFTWPYQHIRKFGLNMSSFSFEAGRMSESGEGSFLLQTRHANEIFRAVDTAISLQSKGGGAPALHPSSAPAGRRPVTPDDYDDADALYSKVNKVRRGPRPHADDALLAGVGEMALDDASVRGPGRETSGRPLPSPTSCLEPPPPPLPVGKARPRSLDLSETEPDYEEVDAGTAATAEAQRAESHYDGVVVLHGQTAPCRPGIHGKEGGRQLRRMLTNPCYDCEEADAGPL